MSFIVYGGELTNVGAPTPAKFDLSVFRAPEKVELVGFYPDRAQANVAWRGRAQATVDNALMRFFVHEVDNVRTFEVEVTRLSIPYDQLAPA